jgi:hypothetical protein
MPVFNIAQALLRVCNYRLRKFTADELETRLTLFANPTGFEGGPRAPSLTAVASMFSKGVFLPNASYRCDVPGSLRMDVADSAAIFQSAHDELLQNLLNGKLAIRGRRLENGAWGSIEYLPGRGPPYILMLSLPRNSRN